MMKLNKALITLAFTCIFFNSIAQNIKILEPSIETELDFSEEFISKFNTKPSFDACEQVWQKMQKEGRQWKDATKEEQDVLKYCDEVREDVWDIVGAGCSWYCGGGQDSLSASSALKSQSNNSYEAKNAHDLSFKTAWVEGVSGYGVGEYLEYHVQPTNPRITQIRVVNGYVKSERAWRNNSRARSLKMYIDNKPYAILHLKDVRAVQVFNVEPIGYSDRDNQEELKNKPVFIMKFEIIDVYPGDKYEDTAITEIYFDGIDVH